MSISHYNGGSVVAMVGKDCVGIACDKRMGARYCTIDTNFNKIYEMGPQLFVGIPGLATDAITLSQLLKFRMNMFELRENRPITPEIFSSIVSNILYEKRFGPYFVEPIVAGLEAKTHKPYLSSFDSIGCLSIMEDFACAGNSSDQSYGICESLWEPGLEPDDLFETLSQALTNAFDRDASSGWGANVYIIEKDKVTVTELKTRMD